MSNRYPWILPDLVGRTPPLTYTAIVIDTNPVDPSTIPVAATTTRYPFDPLSYFAIDDKRNSLLGQRWAHLKWLLSKSKDHLHQANEKGRIRMDLKWLSEIRLVPDYLLDGLVEEASQDRREAMTDLMTMKGKINELLDVLRVKRRQRVEIDYRKGIPPVNALSTIILHAVMKDIDANLETIRVLVDRYEPNGSAAFTGMQVNDLAQWREIEQRSAEAQQKIRRYMTLKKGAFVAKRGLDVLTYDLKQLNEELDSWSRAKSGLATACGSFHLDDPSSSESGNDSKGEGSDMEEDNSQ
ncbi:hypothetical protein CALCODRAFT_484078 [Calocera cornea HHB12733]|uniref:Uncharacterized protein n=1 Tax=Calocera cornea HHB12733 TaxID=1353952 RepID=A0A165F6C8_9BASI|nr:hypothetical protein CALCODRAFT_484078 [Calocera cornea HHB12733]